MNSPEIFLIDDYKLKLDYLKSHLDRFWIRFNFFLTIETGLFAFLGYMVFDKGNSLAVPFTCLIGLMVSSLWYVISSQDRALVEAYRSRAARVMAIIPAESVEALGWSKEDHAAAKVKSKFNNLFSWYASAFSITSLPAILALLLVFVWGGILLFGGATFNAFAQGAADAASCGC